MSHQILYMILWLVGGLEHEFMTFHTLGMSSSQLTNSYFSEQLKPPTSYGIYLDFMGFHGSIIGF
jgi:hypothetical protein